MADVQANAITDSQHPVTGAGSLWRVIPALGLAQVISWGTLYYSLTVLAAPIRSDLGVSDVVIFGAFTLGQLLSGAVTPIVGRRIDDGGGRTVMAYGSVIAAASMATLACAQGPILFTIGWMLGGLAMAACLYDAAFATLHYVASDRYRRAVTGLTLFGGFASTVFWPLSHAVGDAWGWRAAFLFFAIIHLLVCLPLHLFVIPKSKGSVEAASAPKETAPSPHPRDTRFYWLAASFAASTFVFSAVSAYLIAALTGRGFTVEQAVAIGALIGPMQVLARAIEWAFAGRARAISVGAVACTLGLIGVLLLALTPAQFGLGMLFALCYGASNGLLTIARGIVPADLFGASHLGATLGALARPSFFAKALAPVMIALSLKFGFSIGAAVLALAGVAALAVVFYLNAVKRTQT